MGRADVSDIKLFRINEGSVSELVAAPHDLEKQLQTFIEQNLETLLGIRFLASEYSTGPLHGGRIDTLGMDEDNSPVIIEYKRSKSENVINQGLFYLDWLLDHQGEFAILAIEQLGPDAKDSIDWSSPRLLCIAQDFTRYDEHAVRQMNRNIELIRYRRYGNEFILFELVNAVIASSGGGSTGTPKPSPTYKTVDEYLAGAPPDLHALYDDLQTQLVALGDDVQEKHLKYYIAFKRIQNFACVEVHPHARKLLVFVKVDPGAIELTEGFTRDVTDIGHFGTGDLEITIGSRADLDRAMPLIEESYQAS